MASRSTVRSSVVDRIQNLRKRNAYNSYYVPEGGLDTVLDESCIWQLVQEDSYIVLPDRTAVFETIVKGGRKTLAILMTIGDQQALMSFIRHFDNESGPDGHLPLPDQTAVKLLSTKEKATRFLRDQWQFLAVVIKEDGLRMTYDDRRIFPYLDEKLSTKQGGSSTLFRLEVDSSNLKMKVPLEEGVQVSKIRSVDLNRH